MGNPVTSHADGWIKKMHLLLPSFLTPTSFDSDVEECRRKMEVASKPRKEARRRTPRVATTMKTLSHWLMAPSRCF